MSDVVVPAVEKKAGLSKPQVRILAVLAKLKAPAQAALLADKAGVARTWITGFVHRSGKANATLSLHEQKFVKVVELPLDGTSRKERCYEITSAGRKALDKATAG